MRRLLYFAGAVGLLGLFGLGLAAAQWRWGPWTATWQALSNTSERVLVLDTRGRILRQVRAYRVSQPRLVELGGASGPELLVTTYSGAGVCCRTVFTFERGSGGPVNTLTLDIGSQDAPDVQRVSGPSASGPSASGPSAPDLVGRSDVLAGHPFAAGAAAGVNFVLALNGSHYRDVTWEAPGPARALSETYRARYLQAKPGSTAARAALQGFVANMIAWTREPEALAWVRAQAAPRDSVWMQSLWKATRARVDGFSCRFDVTQSRDLNGPANDCPN